MDAFNKQRAEKRVLSTTFEEEPIEMVLGYKDVRRTAKDWKTFSANSTRSFVPNAFRDNSSILDN